MEAGEGEEEESFSARMKGRGWGGSGWKENEQGLFAA